MSDAMTKRDHEMARDRALRAWKALDALELGTLTQADRARVGQVRRGMRALDDVQADVKAAIDEALDANTHDTGPVATALRAVREAWMPEGAAGAAIVRMDDLDGIAAVASQVGNGPRARRARP